MGECRRVYIGGRRKIQKNRKKSRKKRAGDNIKTQNTKSTTLIKRQTKKRAKKRENKNPEIHPINNKDK